MEPKQQASSSGTAVLIRTRPVYALCNVHFCSLRFVNAAGGVSGEYTLKRTQKRGGGMLITRSILSDEGESSGEKPS